MTKLEAPLPRLEIDEKWSIAYAPAMNDRPVSWYRYDVFHSTFDEHNGVTAMFYALLEAQNKKDEE